MTDESGKVLQKQIWTELVERLDKIQPGVVAAAIQHWSCLRSVDGVFFDTIFGWVFGIERYFWYGDTWLDEARRDRYHMRIAYEWPVLNNNWDFLLSGREIIPSSSVLVLLSHSLESCSCESTCVVKWPIFLDHVGCLVAQTRIACFSAIEHSKAVAGSVIYLHMYLLCGLIRTVL